MDAFATVGMWVSRRFLSNQIGFCFAKSLSYPVVRLPHYGFCLTSLVSHYEHVGLGVELLREESPKFELPEKSPIDDTTKLLCYKQAPMLGAGDTIRNIVLIPLKWIFREHSTNLMFDRLKSWREFFEPTTLEQKYEKLLNSKPSS